MFDLNSLSDTDIDVLEGELVSHLSRWKILTYYPETGALSRGKYPRHMEFFRLGGVVKTRGFVAANRVGKSEGGGGYEIALHLTGRYPDWWSGHRFEKPNDWWAAGDTKETVRDIIQHKMIGPEENRGTGLIPGEDLGKIVKRQNGNGAVDTVAVQWHDATGKAAGWSRLAFKSYDQGREAFQGTEKDGIWLDEESDEGIRAECVMRLMTTGGLLIETFTPLKGMTPIVKKYMPTGVPVGGVHVGPDRAVVMAGWDHAPHLGKEEKARMLAECEPHLIDARTKGIPALGEGAVFDTPISELIVKPFAIPSHWPQILGIDFGWDHPTAVMRAAWDRDDDVFYLVSEYAKAKEPPMMVAGSVKSWGAWIPVSWPHDGHQSGGKFDAKDQQQLHVIYKGHGLKMLSTHAQNQDGTNGLESSILEMQERMRTGKFKVFATCQGWIEEYGLYHREKGMIVKEQDDRISASRYAHMMRRFARVRPVADTSNENSNVGDDRAGY